MKILGIIQLYLNILIGEYFSKLELKEGFLMTQKALPEKRFQKLAVLKLRLSIHQTTF